MRRWSTLTARQQEELRQLFATPPSPEWGTRFKAMKAEDGDAMPFVEVVRETWEEIASVRRQGVEAFRRAYREVSAQWPEDPEQRRPDPFRQKLFVLYDHHANRRALLNEPSLFEGRLRIFDLAGGRGRSRLRPTTAEVDEVARRLVQQSLETHTRRYARKKLPATGDEVRSCEQLVLDLAQHFKVPRSTIQERLNEAVFSLEREFPDLAYPLPE